MRKGLISFILSLCIMLFIPMVVVATDDIKGDINHNGKIDLKDIILLIKKYLNTDTASNEDIIIGDMNDNGKIDLKDIILLIKKYLNIDIDDSKNIEMYFVERNTKGIEVFIIDRDNKGFAMNENFFRLELIEDGKTKKIIYPVVSVGVGELGYYMKNKSKDYGSWSVINKIPDNIKLKAGHYRLTRMLSGHLFSTEFDLPDDI